MMKFLSEKSLTNKQMRGFIVFAILVNAVGLLSPVLGSNDSNFYAVIAKHMVVSHDWINLMFNNQDWLDKPHFPFWMIAISYKLFGINTFAYIFPGFLFDIIGGYYTYLLAKHMFASREVGLLSALIYFTSLHLMLSSIDVRQEAYLLGEIMPACYYWYLYNENVGIYKKYLLLAAFFTGLAMMTKGIFVCLTIFSGLMTLWMVIGKWRNFIRLKWFLALIVSFIFIIPELLVLYLQFDANPEKTIFGRHGVSGIDWFFWGSQFGRFFDIGPITSGKSGSLGHYFYFIHTFLWAFLPWSIVAVFATWNIIKSNRGSRDVPENFQSKKNRLNYIYLMGTFLPTFVLFSLTKFQLDHYTNILLPFVSIVCAEFLFNTATKFVRHPVCFVQIGLSDLLCASVVILGLLILSGGLFIVFLIGSILIVGIFVILKNNYPLTKAIVYPVLAISLVFIFVESVNAKLYSKYDLGYQVAKEFPTLTESSLIVDYNVNSLSLEFFDKGAYRRVGSISGLSKIMPPFYLVVNRDESKNITDNFPKALLINEFSFIKQEQFVSTLFNRNKRKNDTETIFLYKIN